MALKRKVDSFISLLNVNPTKKIMDHEVIALDLVG